MNVHMQVLIINRHFIICRMYALFFQVAECFRDKIEFYKAKIIMIYA